MSTIAELDTRKSLENSALSFLDETLPEPDLRLIEDESVIRISNYQDYTSMNQRDRRELESKIFEFYFQDTQAENKSERYSRMNWLADKCSKCYKISADVFSRIFQPLTKENYPALIERDRKDIIDFVEFSYMNRINSFGTYKERVKDMAKNLVLPYNNTRGFLSEDVVENVLTKRTVSRILKERMIEEYSSLEVKCGKKVGVNKLLEKFGVSSGTFYRWLKTKK